MNPEDPLAEWNRLNKQNTEELLVSAMFRGFVASTHSLDQYSNWLAAGAGAGVVLIVGNVADFLQVVSPPAFRMCIGLALGSLLFGAISKFFAVQCQAAERSNAHIEDAVTRILDKFYDEEQQISAMAQEAQREFITDFSMANVMLRFSAPFSAIERGILGWWISRNGKNRQVAYLLPVKLLRWQAGALTFQIITIVAAVVSAAAGARAV